MYCAMTAGALCGGNTGGMDRGRRLKKDTKKANRESTRYRRKGNLDDEKEKESTKQKGSSENKTLVADIRN